MNKRIVLPGTDLILSPIVLGTVKAGVAWQGREADAILDAYLDMGGNALDTARVYLPPREGCGEETIGGWLRRSGKRNRVILMTKGGHPDVGKMNISRLSREDMEADLANSLRALGTECIDLYFYHRDDPAIPAGELVERMEGFRRAGKIRWYGCSNWSTRRMEEAAAYASARGYAGFVANECLYNVGTAHMGPLTDPTMVAANGEMLDFHRRAGMAMTPYCALCSGYFHRLMAGGPEAVRGSKYDTPGNRAMARALERVTADYHVTLAQAELAFLLSRPFPVAALAGVSRLSQLGDMMGAMDVSIPPEAFSL